MTPRWPGVWPDLGLDVYKRQLLYYPGDMNRRIRWEAASFAEPEDRDRRALMEKAQTDFAAAVKQAKMCIRDRED